ncbi:MAG TPA: AraC family transcriptional regulator [Nonomuraea sp.]|nr:AraC family transcriptional regulator [Nonomuraea sp.]
MGSLIRATNMWGYPELVRELGGNPAPLLARCHLPGGVEHQEDAFVSVQAFVRLLETSAAELACPDFGLRLARWQGLDILGPVAVMARNAQTVLGGLEAIGRYLHVHSPALKLTAAPRPGVPELRFTYEVIERPPLRSPQGFELSAANLVRMLSFLGGPDARPSVFAFTHEQLGPDSAYQEALACPVVFGQAWCGFDLPVELGERPIDSADPETRRIAMKYLESQYLPGDALLSERVAELARRLLPTGQCSVDAIADQLALHPRTLQRHLEAEGVTCQDVIEATRRDQAAKYLAEPRFLLSQIAGLLGYAEQSTLNRSCRRWFGRTPRQYRAELAR